MLMPHQFENTLQTRLAALRNVPVDTSRLDRLVRARIPPENPRHFRWLMPLSAIAASILIFAIVAMMMLQGSTAQASPVEIAQLHRDIVAGTIPTMQATSIDEANQAIAAMSGSGSELRLPQAPAIHTMACCMRNVENKKVACLLLDDAGTPVTMVVADSITGVPEPAEKVTHGGVAYYVQNVGDLVMVTTQREHRRICLIGHVSRDRLLKLANGLHY